ncbi:MAG: hypothetical protein LBS26_06025, partial [Campylobacteraceae bacterium]|nr:hypothetical protein [Campylobacteraceae bacterium]
MKRLALFAFAFFVMTGLATGQTKEEVKAVKQSENKQELVKIKITIDGRELTASLINGAAARDFISLLPLTLVLEDYNRTEKISALPKKLSTSGEPSGYDPSIGDIAFYAPWGNLCIYYRDFGYSNSLVFLGKIDGGMEVFNVS